MRFVQLFTMIRSTNNNLTLTSRLHSLHRKCCLTSCNLCDFRAGCTEGCASLVLARLHITADLLSFILWFYLLWLVFFHYVVVIRVLVLFCLLQNCVCNCENLLDTVIDVIWSCIWAGDYKTDEHSVVQLARDHVDLLSLEKFIYDFWAQFIVSLKKINIKLKTICKVEKVINYIN